MPGQLGPTSRVFDCVLSRFVTVLMLDILTINLSHFPTSNHIVLWLWKLLAFQCRHVQLVVLTIPSVIHTTRGISAETLSSIAAAARGGGTNSKLALACAWSIASFTFLNTGRSRCVLPAFFGLVPPTI